MFALQQTVARADEESPLGACLFGALWLLVGMARRPRPNESCSELEIARASLVI